MYGDILQDLREGLAVSSAYDARLMRGIKNASRVLLRAYNFREALRRAVVPVGAGMQSVALPGDVGKIKAVRLTVLEGGTRLFKRLRRREEGMLPVFGGPNYYYLEGTTVVLDSAMPADAVGYDADIWYQTDDPAVVESWMSTRFNDVLEHKAGAELAVKLRKSEAFQIYSALWQEDVAILGRYIPEIEFGDMELAMGELNRSVPLERYPAS